MLYNISDRISFLALFLTIVLLPVFFLPFTKIPIETSKGLLLVIGLVVSLIFWMAARLYEGRLTIPRSLTLFSGLGVVLAFLLSAFFSGVTQVSFFGTMLDIGTFWFMLICFLLMFACSIILKDSRSTKKVLYGTLISFIVVLFVQAVRFFSPALLTFGVLSTKTDNIFGTFNSLGIFAGFAVVISLFAVEFFSISKTLKWLLGALIVLALLLVAAVNFSLVWMLVGVFALLIFIYKVSFFSGINSAHTSEPGSAIEASSKHFPAFPLAIVMVSVSFILSSQLLGGFIPKQLQLSNVEVSPSFSSTLTVTKAVLQKSPILGIGPNKFGQAWALHKPSMVNSSQFWNIYFESGSGLLPSFVSTTGLLGLLAWLVFFIFLVRAGLRSIFSRDEAQNNNFKLTIFFLAAIFLFTASFFYTVGAAIFLLAFVFTGIFIGLSSNREGGEIVISFQANPKKSFFFVFLLVILMILFAGAAFKYVERFVSASYFGKAVTANTLPEAEASIQKALSLYQNDLYLRSYAQIYLLKFNSLISKGSSITDAEKADLQKSFDQAVSGAQLAISYNKESYLNYQTLGYVYNTVGSIGVTGAYDKAVQAYQGASALNPLNPGLKLSIANVYLAAGKITEAKDYANQALALKSDYSDALVTLSQIAKSQGDISGAISYAQQALALAPDNKNLSDYLDSLQKPSAPTPPSSSSSNSQTSHKTTQ